MNEKGTLNGEARKLLPGGDALVHAAQGTFLVANVLPGETLNFIPQPRRRGVARGQLVQCLSPSPDRVSPCCEVAACCGGCAFQYVSEARQGAIKSQWVRDAFAAALQPETRFVPVGSLSLQSRRRVRWYLQCDAQGAALGFRARASHTVVPTSHCPVVTPQLDALRNRLQAWLAQDYAFACMIDSIRAVQLTDGIHLILEGATISGIAPPFSSIGELPVQWWIRNDGVTRPLEKPVRPFHDVLPVADHDLAIAIGPDDFVQGQVAGNRAMIAQIVAWCAGARRVTDLFSGVGNLSLPVAAAIGAEVTGAEAVEASVRAANANAKRLGINAAYHVVNLFGDFSLDPFAGADVLILDPPRKGARAVCKRMGALLPGRIIMVNCDVASGGRDAALLQAHGYRLRALHALDLFPCAGHVEALSLWER